MAVQVQEKYPATQCLIWHRAKCYSFFLPDDWYPLSWSDDQACEFYGPDPNDPYTMFAVDITDLGTQVKAGDLDFLAELFFQAVEELPEVNIELRKQKVVGKLLEMETQYTFCERGEMRKRWVRVFYHETYEIAMTAQGATPEKYDYWLPLFFEMMMTTRIHNKKPRSEFDN